MVHSSKPRILILYAEVMDYLLAGIQQYKSDFPESEILLFELDRKKLTPFTFRPEGFAYEKKSDYSSFSDFYARCTSFKPDIVLVSGRMDEHYLKVAKKFKKDGVYTVTLQDTQFEQSLRQKIIRTFSTVLYRQYFRGFWGAGSPQTAFGYSLGFNSMDIFEGIYTANKDIFNVKRNFSNSNDKSKRILFVGRFSKEKNIKRLIAAFISVNEDLGNNHELLLIGDGPLRDSIKDDKKIKILPFEKGQELAIISKSVDIFCLPSLYEPWGLVIHEFALAGLPLLLSQKCGAKTKFLIEGFNGLSFDPYDLDSFKTSMKKLLLLDKPTLVKMGVNSNYLGLKYSPKDWAMTLNSLILRADNWRKA